MIASFDNLSVDVYKRQKEDGDGYEVIAGQRRVRASELAGINTVPAFVLPLAVSYTHLNTSSKKRKAINIWLSAGYLERMELNVLN